VKRVDDHYYCKCPVSMSLGNVSIMFTDWNEQGWTFAGRSQPIDARTCKHLKELLGEEVRIYTYAMSRY